LNYLYNKCDFIVRFTYTQIPILRNLLRKIMFRRWYSSDFKNIDITFEQLKKTLCQYEDVEVCLLYTSPSPRDVEESRMPSSA